MSLGTLTLDLIVKTSNYVEGLSKAARQTERNTREMQRSLRQLEAQAEATRLAFRNTIIGFLSYQGGRGLIDMADNYRAMGERVKMATNNLEEYDYAQKRLLNSANTSFRSLAEAQELFIATSDNLRGGYGYSLEQALDVTDSLSFAFVRNATAADKARTAINVYDRALATGKLTAQDWQSINSAVPTLAKNIGDAMGKTTQEINKMGMSGQLATSMMNEGLLLSLRDNEEAANSMANTVADAFTKLNNEFSTFWGELNQDVGITSGIANSIIFFADNLKYAKDIAIALSVVMLARLSPAVATNTVAIASNIAAHANLAKASIVTDYTVARVTNQTVAMSAAMAAGAASARVLSTALSLVGGPVGAVALAATGLLLFSDNAKTAIRSTDELEQSILGLESRMQSMTVQMAKAEIVKYERDLEALRNTADKLKQDIEMASGKLNSGMGSEFQNLYSLQSKGFLFKGKDVGASNVIELEGELSKVDQTINRINDSIVKLSSFTGTIRESAQGNIELTGKAKDLYDSLNKQAFMLLNTSKDAELMYQRQHGYLKDISAEQFKQIKARQFANDLLQAANDREKELESILNSVNEQYNNMGLSTHQVMLNRLLDLEVSLEQFAVIKAMIGAIEDFEANKPKTGSKSSLNYFDDKLKSINEEIYKMKSINDSIQLLGGESKYTAVSELTTEFNNQNSVLANISAKQREILMLQAQELDSQKQINEILTLRNDYDKSFEDMYFELSLVGQSQRAIEELTFARELEKRAKEMSIGMSAENVAALNSEIERVLALRAEYTNLKDIIDGNPVEGISEGYKKFLDDAGTVRDQWSEATQFAFNGMTDAFASFASGTQTSFRDMTASILRDLSKILIQAAMVNTLKNASGGGGFLGTLAGWLGYADGGLVGAKSYSTGGYTGIGSKYQEAGIVHKDEFVMSKEATNYLGVDYLNALHNSAKNRKPLPAVVRSYAVGGAVGGTSSSAIFAENQLSPINLNLVVYSDGSAEVDASKDGKSLDGIIKFEVRKEISNQLRQRGALAR